MKLALAVQKIESPHQLIGGARNRGPACHSLSGRTTTITKTKNAISRKRG